jgi:ribose transport system substrate-binding protein
MVCLAAFLFTACATTEDTAEAPQTEDSGTDATADTSADTTEDVDSDEETTADAPEMRKVFFTNAFNTAPFCAPLNEQALATAAENNVELTIVDGEGDAAVQLDQIKNAINQGYDGILYFPADAEGSIAIIKTLNESGVPYAVIDSMVDESVRDTITVFAGPNNVEMGEVAGETCAELLDGKGKVVCLMGAAGTDPATNRQIGFENIMEQYPDIEIIAKQNVDNWDPAVAMTIMQDYLTRFDEIDFIYTHDDGIFQGVQQALSQAGLTGTIPAVSTGANNVGCAAIDAGELYGSVLHSAKEEGQLGMEAVIDVMDGKIQQGDNEWYQCQCPLVTKDNIEEWRGWGW